MRFLRKISQKPLKEARKGCRDPFFQSSPSNEGGGVNPEE
jgi:hypothetical protein